MSTKKKTKTDAISWAKPALQQGITHTQDAFAAAKPITDQVTSGLGGLFSGYLDRAQSGSPTLQAANQGVAATARGDYLGANPGASTYARLMGPNTDTTGLDAIKGLLSRGTSPTGDYYKKVLGGDYLNSNPYADHLVDDVADDVNGSFSLSGRYGSGAHQGVLARESGKIRAGLYNSERDRMNQVAGMADAYDLNDRASVLGAANAYGDYQRADGAQQLAAAQSGDAAYDNERQRMLGASAMAPALNQADYASLGPLLALAQQYQQTPFGGVGAYNQNINALSQPYSKTTQKTGGVGATLGAIGGIAQGVGGLMGGFGALGGMGGLLGGAAGGAGMGTLSGMGNIASSSGLLSQSPFSFMPKYSLGG